MSNSKSNVIYESGYVVSTYAGTWEKGYRDGVKGEAQFNRPTSLATDKNGDIYVADRSNYRLRKITVEDGTVHTVAGTGIKGFKDGPACEAQFQYLGDIAIGDNGDVIIVDNGIVRAFSPTEKTVRTIVGREACLGYPHDVAIAADGSVLVCDTENCRVVKIRGGSVETVAGDKRGYADGEAHLALFSCPDGIAVSSCGDIYVGDTYNHRLRKIDARTGVVSTVAGTGAKGWRDGNASEAQFSRSRGIAVGPDGRVYISDRGNRCRRLDPVNGRVVTLAGTGEQGFCDGDGSKAKFKNVAGLTLGRDGVLYVADACNHRIRAITKHPEAKLSIAKHPEAKLSITKRLEAEEAELTKQEPGDELEDLDKKVEQQAQKIKALTHYIADLNTEKAARKVDLERTNDEVADKEKRIAVLQSILEEKRRTPCDAVAQRKADLKGQKREETMLENAKKQRIADLETIETAFVNVHDKLKNLFAEEETCVAELNRVGTQQKRAMPTTPSIAKRQKVQKGKLARQT